MCVYILYSHRVISLTGFYNGPVHRPYGDLAAFAAVHRNCTVSVQLPYGGCAEIIRLLCDPRVFFGILVPKLYSYSFLIEMAQNTVKTETPADSNMDIS